MALTFECRGRRRTSILGNGQKAGRGMERERKGDGKERKGWLVLALMAAVVVVREREREMRGLSGEAEVSEV